MAKSGLANSLLEKRIEPKDGWGSLGDSTTVNYRLWAWAQPNQSGEYIATIDAAWTEEGKVKISVHDPFGNTGTMWLEQVKLRTI